jgi:hypothetical protein
MLTLFEQFWSTVSVFIDNGVSLEDKTMRWQHALKNLYYIIGGTRRKSMGLSTAALLQKH